MTKDTADWNNIPPVLFVTNAKTDGVVWDVHMCSVPHALAPEVVYRRNLSAVDAASPLREQVTGAIRAHTAATTAEADAAVLAILRHINNWFGLGRDQTNPFAPR